MIKANELRIGNIYNRKHGNGRTETAITIEILCKIFSDDLEYAINDFESIPLTEEWLLIFGADEHYYIVQHEAGSSTFEGYDLHGKSIEKNNKGTWDVKVRCSSNEYIYLATVEYVHHLQNLFFDIGKELPINLL